MPDPEEFYRIKRLPPYVFAEVNRLKAARGVRRLMQKAEKIVSEYSEMKETVA